MGFGDKMYELSIQSQLRDTESRSTCSCWFLLKCHLISRDLNIRNTNNS